MSRISQDATVAVLGTMDTKGAEHAYVCDVIAKHGVRTLVIDTGILGSPRDIHVDISSADVARAAGTNLAAIRAIGSRGPAVETMQRGLTRILRELYDEGRIQGAVALGGAEGTVLGTQAMQVLPLGFPKLMVSAVASGARTFGTYMGASDLSIMHSVVDCAGLNYISREVFANAAAGIAGMARDYLDRQKSPRGVGAVAGVSMLGNTQAAFDHLAPRLAEIGLEPVPFHANGVGGMALDSLAGEGGARVVIDMTLNEVSNWLVGGVTAAPATRMRAAGSAGVPQVVVPGCVDFFTFGAIETVPTKYLDRPLYRHNPHFTLVRATGEEMEAFGCEVAQRLNSSTGPVTVVWPSRGLSIENRPGGSFWDPEADRRFLESLMTHLTVPVRLVEVDAHINDEETAEAVVTAVIELLPDLAQNLDRRVPTTRV